MGKKQQSSGSDSRKQIYPYSVFPRPDSSYPEGWIYLFLVELVYKLQDRW